jgi:hypothetical protein
MSADLEAAPPRAPRARPRQGLALLAWSQWLFTSGRKLKP